VGSVEVRRDRGGERWKHSLIVGDLIHVDAAMETAVERLDSLR
jgi:hypothetical protein